MIPNLLSCNERILKGIKLEVGSEKSGKERKLKGRGVREGKKEKERGGKQRVSLPDLSLIDPPASCSAVTRPGSLDLSSAEVGLEPI